MMHDQHMITAAVWDLGSVKSECHPEMRVQQSTQRRGDILERINVSNIHCPDVTGAHRPRCTNEY